MKSLPQLSALIIVLILMVSGCSDPVSQPGTSFPAGTYVYERLLASDSSQLMERQRLVLASQSQAVLYDTIYQNSNGTWEIFSTWDMSISLQSVGNGYYRGVTIRRANSVPVDTLLYYWLFSRRGDSVYVYRGHGFTGSNIGIIGRWQTSDADTALVGTRYTLDFRSDSVSIEGRVPGWGDLSAVFPYKTNRDTLRIMTGLVNFGDRFSVTPGWGLYITSRPTHGYAAIK